MRRAGQLIYLSTEDSIVTISEIIIIKRSFHSILFPISLLALSRSLSSYTDFRRHDL